MDKKGKSGASLGHQISSWTWKKFRPKRNLKAKKKGKKRNLKAKKGKKEI